jgi:hypothetical protein
MATMTFNHSADEARALEEPAKEKDMSKTAVLKQALRLYQMVHIRTKAGSTMVFEGGPAEPRKTAVFLL